MRDSRRGVRLSPRILRPPGDKRDRRVAESDGEDEVRADAEPDTAAAADARVRPLSVRVTRDAIQYCREIHVSDMVFRNGVLGSTG